jgi:hypothetical protein
MAFMRWRKRNGFAVAKRILLLATDSETIGPYLFSHHVARQLCAVLIDADFGPLPK